MVEPTGQIVYLRRESWDLYWGALDLGIRVSSLKIFWLKESVICVESPGEDFILVRDCEGLVQAAVDLSLNEFSGFLLVDVYFFYSFVYWDLGKWGF